MLKQPSYAALNFLTRLTNTPRLVSNSLFRRKNNDLLIVAIELIGDNSGCYGTTHTPLPSVPLLLVFLVKIISFCLWQFVCFPYFLNVKSLKITWNGVRSTHTHCEWVCVVTCAMSLSLLLLELTVTNALIFTWFLSVFYSSHCHKVIRSSCTTQKNSDMSYKLINQ